MTYKTCKELFEDSKEWAEIDTTEMSDHVKWTRFKIFDEVFMALSVLTGYDDYRPGIGFVPTEKMRLKQLYRVDQEGRLREVSKTEALDIIKEAKRRYEKK
jgi:hypothetical protein